VITAHGIQLERQGIANGQLEASGVKRYCQLNTSDVTFVEKAATQLSLSPRGCQRVLKVARTIADLEGCDSIDQGHLAEAMGFRQPARP
jgi:magnesium chelatase family protein